MWPRMRSWDHRMGMKAGCGSHACINTINLLSGLAQQVGHLKTGMSSILWPPMRSWDCMEVMRASRRRFSSFSTMNSRLRTSSAVMAASLSASARRFCSSTYMSFCFLLCMFSFCVFSFVRVSFVHVFFCCSFHFSCLILFLHPPSPLPNFLFSEILCLFSMSSFTKKDKDAFNTKPSRQTCCQGLGKHGLSSQWARLK